MSPEDRRDAAVSAAVEVGASVVAVTPMANPDAPTVVVAYAVSFAAPDPGVLAALAVVRADTEIDVSGLIPVEVTPDEVSPV